MTKTDKPLASVIICCYKKFDYIFDALSSALSQDYPRLEIIIADDSSDNFPEQEINEFIQKNINQNIERVIINRNSHNLGTVKNLNQIIPLSKGEYIINLAGDDMFYENSTISKIVDRFIETGTDLLSCSRDLCEEKSLKHIAFLPTKEDLKSIVLLDTPEKQKKSFLSQRFYSIASGSATYYTRNHFKEYGYFDERYVLWEDGPKYLSYASKGRCITTAYDIISIKYRTGGSSDLSNIWLRNSRYEIDRKNYIKYALQDYPSYKEDIFQGIWKHWDTASNNYQRIYLMLKYPSFGFDILKKKFLHRPLR